MKKLIYLSIVALFCLAFLAMAAGCSSTDSEETAEAKTEEAVEVKEEEAPAEEAKGIFISGAVTSAEVDDKLFPIEPTETFEAGTKTIHLAFYVHDFSTQDEIVVKWNNLETNKEVYQESIKPPEDGRLTNIAFYITDAQGIASSSYNAEIYLNDTLVETIEFSIK